MKIEKDRLKCSGTRMKIFWKIFGMDILKKITICTFALAICLVMFAGCGDDSAVDDETANVPADIIEDAENQSGAEDSSKSAKTSKGIRIPKTGFDLPAGNESVDIKGFCIYEGRSYKCFYGLDEDAFIKSGLLGEELGHVEGTINCWTDKYDYVDLTGSIPGTLYTVKGYDPDFLLCLQYHGEYEYNLMINDNDIELVKGSDITEDRFKITETWKKAYLYKPWEESASCIIDKTEEMQGKIIQAFIDKVAESNVVSRNAVRSGDVVLEKTLDSGNGVLLRGAVYEKGYVRIYGFNQVLVDIGEDAVKPILEMIND